jgi:hypothetical protein
MSKQTWMEWIVGRVILRRRLGPWAKWFTVRRAIALREARQQWRWN